MKKTKQEKREEHNKKLKEKEKRGATLAGQILRTKTVKKYLGQARKMTRK